MINQTRYKENTAWLHQIFFGKLQVCCAVFLVFSQTTHADNVGFYEKVWDDGVNAGYQLVWSTYVQNIDSEPTQQGDFTVTAPPSGGGHCDPSTGICYDPQSSPGTIQSDDPPDELEPILVTASRVDLFLWAFIQGLQGGGGGGGGGGEPVMIARPIPGTDLPTTCNGEYDDDLLDELFSDSSLLGDLQQLTLDSNFDALITLPPGTGGRIEAGAFLVPNGLGGYDFRRIGVDIGQVFAGTNACSLVFGLPSPRTWEPGTIFVHTHPWSEGEDQSIACGPGFEPYTVGPGDADRQFLLGEGIQIGIIIDRDAVTLYYDSDLLVEKTEPRECY